jgi:hypothetical protein
MKCKLNSDFRLEAMEEEERDSRLTRTEKINSITLLTTVGALKIKTKIKKRKEK